MKSIVVALMVGLGLVMPFAASAQMSPIGSYGEWTVSCEAGSFARRCIINASDEAWGEDKIGVVYYPADRILNIVVVNRSFTAGARIDRGADQTSDCLAEICGFARNDFGAALEQGTVLFLTVAGEGKTALTFAKNLLDLRKATAAAKEWVGQQKQP